MESQLNVNITGKVVDFEPEPKFNSLDEILAQVDIYTQYLRSLKSYKDGQVNNILRALLHIHYAWVKERPLIAQRLVDQCFPKDVKAMTVYLLSVKENFFKEDLNFEDLITYYFCISVVWNYTDASANFSKAIVLVGMIPPYLFNLTYGPFEEDPTEGIARHIVRGSLGIFHNIISHCPEYKQHFRENKVNAVVEPYLSNKDDEMKCVAIMIMSSLINEDEADKLEDSGSIKFIIDLIRQALMNSEHKAMASSGYFSALELLNDLSRIAINDKNKSTIVDAGALPLLVNAMDSGSQEEQESAAKTVWTLCFQPYSKQKVQEEANCIKTLEKLSENSNPKVKKSAKGALWELRGEDMHSQEKTSGDQEKHIFISYDWGHAKVVRKIHERLKSDGYKVWIDIDKMGGSTLEAMASAVENAKVVLMCLSEKYKLSPSCRSEAKYTWKRRRPIVPLMMQRKYEPDGWLGIIVGDEFYVDFAKYDFEVAYKMLLEQMKPYISEMEPKDDIDGKVVASVSADTSASPAMQPAESCTVFSTDKMRDCTTTKWTKEQVQQWVTSCHLRSVLNAKLQDFLDSLDGELLMNLCWLKNKAPDYCMTNISKQYDADLLQVLHLTKALNKLL